ncbi:MAG: hypothetical protein QOE83_1994 [Actinomycetota bacterium]|nr:hypothetical protein [Actinomycetota bacterium]
MHELDRIEAALASKRLDHELFERCAQDFLSEIYPGLSPIPGGTDWGRDADIHESLADSPVRLLVTSARTLEGVRKNMRAGIKSMTQHGVPIDRIVLANPARLTQLQRQTLANAARKLGAVLEAVYERSYFASKLRRDGEWRMALLGLPGDPITLSRVPSDLAESPWREIPLVGRQQELLDISTGNADLLVIGVPGVGKTRLLAAIDNVLFVDRDAAADRLADDVRWIKPTVLVIDDAGSRPSQLRQLVRLRQVESDLERYRLIAVCWPDEVDQVRVSLGSASEIKLDLLERAELDQVIMGMGVTGQLAKEEILDQAEGRPGWAVALGDILLRSKDPTSLLNGKALLGQVVNYLHRAQVPDEASDLLATIAAVGGIRETDLDRLAAEVGMPRVKVASLLSDIAKSGLIDVEPRYDSATRTTIRHYEVRPPMLADVLVVERAFEIDVRGLDLRSLVTRWPDKLGAITRSAINSAILGASTAREAANQLFHAALETAEIAPEIRFSLTEHFARLGRQAGEQVLEVARSEFEEWRKGDTSSPWQIGPLVNLSYLLVRWYLLEGALELLLDAALVDARETNPNPGHPMRKLADLIHDFHPELPRREHRDLLVRVAGRWLGDDPSTERWRVYRDVASAALSLHLGSTLSDPGDHHRFRWIETVADEKEVRRTYEEIWPLIRDRCASAPPDLVKGIIDVAADWLRVGGGYDSPFGQTHPRPSIDAAQRFGRRLMEDLVPLSAGHPGLVASLRDTAESFGLLLSIEDDLGPFFADIDRHDDWQHAEEQLRQDVADTVATWAAEEPSIVIERLAVIRTEIELSNFHWPDRVWIACHALALSVADPFAWIDAALNRTLFPSASPFVRRAVEDGLELGEQRLRRLLADPMARSEVAGAVLADVSSPMDLELVVDNLRPTDYLLLKTLSLRHELTLERQRELLTRPAPAARGAVAAAMFTADRANHEGWTPGELEPEWLEAVSLLDPGATWGFHDYEAAELTAFLAASYPETLTAWIAARIAIGLGTGDVYRCLPHGSWEELHALPVESKEELWNQFSGDPTVAWLLARYIVGNDLAWLDHALDRSLFSPEDALSSYDPFGSHPSIEQMASLLVPLGIEPRRVAWLAQGGSWTGEESHRYGQLVQEFTSLAESDDPSVAAVGEAGLEMFAVAQQEALRDERKKRIRGDL